MSLTPDTSDAQIIAAVLAGDVDAYRLLVRRYRDRYARFAIRMLGNSDDADDVLQIAFVRAYGNLAKCREPERFGAWFHQIVINECRTLGVRRGRRELRFIRDDTMLARLASDTDPSMRAEGTDKLQRNIQDALDQLDAAHREAFVLKYIEEVSYEDMADLTGAGISALKMRVKRACDRLRIVLEGQIDG